MNILIFLFAGLLAFGIEGEIPEAKERNDIDPVAVLTSNPGGSTFYNLADIIFSSGSSYDDDGYITQSKFYINGQYVYGSSYTSGYTECFALYGSPAGDCFDMPSGASTVSVKLEVQDNDGNWDDVTKVYTIQEHKGRKYFIKDHLGSVRTTVNRDGNVLGFDDYYPFGLAMDGGHNENTANPSDNYKFTGYEQDDEAVLNLYHANAREYDPVLGRFMQIDNFHDKYPDQSLYNYALNNPLFYTDITGDTVEIAYVYTGPTDKAAKISGKDYTVEESYHTFIIYTDNKTGQKYNITEGYPSNEFGKITTSSFGFGNLERKTVRNPRSKESYNFKEVIPIPKGLTEEVFVKSIINNYLKYDNSVKYELIPSGQNTGNSNSLVGSVLRASGSNFVPQNYFTPGWTRNVLPNQRKN